MLSAEGHKTSEVCVAIQWNTRHWDTAKSITFPTGSSKTKKAVFAIAETRFWLSTLSDVISALRTVVFVYITHRITLDILPIAREAIIDSYFLCLLSHNNKLVLVLYKNEWILFLSKNFILTILWDNQRKRRPILINKEYIYLIFPPTSPHSNNHM